MSLLREIQNSAIDSESDLATLLRKCKVLAARLRNPDFKEWVERELSGYPSHENLPEYRIIHVNSKGHFSGAFQSGLRNADIPMVCMPEELREALSTSYILQPIASLEALVSSASSGTLQEPWNPDIVAHLGGGIYDRMHCMQAWKVIPVHAIVAVIDSVRTRVLNFALEIEAESPGAGEAPADSMPVPQEKVNQIFNTYITGNVQNLATGNTSASQVTSTAENSDALFQGLINALASVRESPEQAAALSAAVEDMRNHHGSSKFADRYHGFISKLADHMQVFGPVVAPYLPALSKFLT